MQLNISYLILLPFFIALVYYNYFYIINTVNAEKKLDIAPKKVGH